MLVFLLAALCFAPLAAEELWVRNRPFKGEVQGAGAAMTADLKELAKALELTLSEAGEGWVAGEAQGQPESGYVLVKATSIPVSQGAKGPMVQVKAFVEAAGGTLKRNADLGTVDVYLTNKTQAAAGDWSNGATGGSGGGDSSHTSPEGYTLTMAPGVNGFSDPNLSKLAIDYAVNQDPSIQGVMKSSKLDYFFANADGGPNAGMGMVMVVEMPSLPGDIDSATAGKIVAGGMVERGQVRKAPTSLKLNGKDFTEVSFTEMRQGQETRNHAFIHVSKANRKVYFFMVVCPEATYRTVSPKLLTTCRSAQIH